jgi:hypothetical protein
MSEIERYMSELQRVLRVRGAVRRRFVRECRDHLLDAASERGEQRAVHDFGPAASIAAAFDAEVAGRRSMRSTALACAGVLATAGSTLALIHAADPGATAPTLWAIVFFVAAQVAGTAAALALLQAFALRRTIGEPAQMALLARRNLTALIAAGLTLFAAGAALPGRGSAAALLAGPLLAGVALVAVLRARGLTRRLDGAAVRAVRPPLQDVVRILGARVTPPGTRVVLALTTCVAAAAAFLRDTAESAGAGQATVTAAIEALAVVGCFALSAKPWDSGVGPRAARHRCQVAASCCQLSAGCGSPTRRVPRCTSRRVIAA